jgi:hypothetical protein
VGVLDGQIDLDASRFVLFILYPEQIKVFINSGKILAWGIVPTLYPEDIERETIESIWDLWMGRLKQVAELGLDMQKLINQSLITPSCGMGSLGLDSAEKVIRLTTAISRKVRKLKFSA